VLKDFQDAQGHAFWDYLRGKDGFEIFERDDGYFDASRIDGYFSEYKNWSGHEKKAMQFVKGKVLDIGCGAGRHALFLQNKEFDVTGVDISPLAIKVCKKRGLKNVKALSIMQINPKLGLFDTVLMLGNNFGLFENFNKARKLLVKLSRITTSRGRIIAETRNPYKTDSPEHLSYQKLNRKRGRMSGQVRIRVRYKKYVTPWFDYLFVSKEEMKDILNGTRWRVKKFIEGKSEMYIAVIEKKKKI